MKPTALILAGDGLNCQDETAYALELAGFQTEIRNINELVQQKIGHEQLLSSYRVLAIPGGFSFGDDLGSGRVLALKIKHQLRWRLQDFALNKGLVIGICNGFQALISLGLFGRDISITHNAKGKFLNTWVRVTPWHGQCVWLRGLGTFDLPIRHGEGRIVLGSSRRSDLLSKMEKAGMTCLRYETDVNGSEERLAGLCDGTGRIFGLMPHPEAFVRWTQHPEWTSQPEKGATAGIGLQIFENAFQECRKLSEA